MALPEAGDLSNLTGRQQLALEEIAQAHFSGLHKPKPQLVSEWAEQTRHLSLEASAERGLWRNRPFQSEPMNCLTPDTQWQQVVLMVASQTMKTELILNFLGYIIDRDPGPALIVEPREIDGRALSKDRINPMIRDTPQLTAKVIKRPTRGMSVRGSADEKPRPANIGNSALHIKFLGGHVSIAGSHSPAGLAMRPIRYLMLDEIDRYPTSAGQEGDPVLLAMRRTDEFSWNKKILLCSTPTIEGYSRIQRAYEESDQRRAQVPCPLCGEYQELDFYRLKWEKDKPNSAQYQCFYCNQFIPHFRKGWMLSQGKWVPTNPGHPVAGFWLSQMYSIRRSWPEIIAEFLSAEKAPDTLRVFVNTVLAQTWKERAEAPDWKRLYERAEPYPLQRVPPGGLILTCGVDVQEDRVELMVVAWGRNKESWLVDYRVIEGSVRQQAPVTLADGTKKPSVWQKLSEVLNHQYPHAESGVLMKIEMLAIDSGWATQEVYWWARQHGPGRVMITRGTETNSNRNVLVGAPIPVDISFGGRKIARGARFWPINTAHAKDELYGWLRLDRPAADGGDPFPPGYVHLPQFNSEWFKELTNEALEMTVDRKGLRRYQWVKRGKNEALDCRIYARAAAYRLGIDRWVNRDWKGLEASVASRPGQAAPPTPPGVPMPPAADPEPQPVPEGGATTTVLPTALPEMQAAAPAPEPARQTKVSMKRTRSSYAPHWQRY